MMSNKDVCPLCEEPANKEMVQCDECYQWYHFVCVNVTEDVSSRDFVCNRCLEQQENEQFKTPTAKATGRDEITEKQIQNEVMDDKLALAKIEEERKLQLEVQMEFIQKKYEILNAFADDCDDEYTVAYSEAGRTQAWVQNNVLQPQQTSQTQVPNPHSEMQREFEKKERADQVHKLREIFCENETQDSKAPRQDCITNYQREMQRLSAVAL